MKLEFELKSTDILLLKVLSCILMAVLTLNLFIFPGLNKQADLSASEGRDQAGKTAGGRSDRFDAGGKGQN